MQEDKIKEAFSKIKEDMFSLSNEISDIKLQFQELNQVIKNLSESIIELRCSKEFLDNPPTDSIKTSTYSMGPTHNPADGQEIGGWNTHNFDTSIGNDGVPTDKQTNRQTVQQTHFMPEIPSLVTTKMNVPSADSTNVVTNESQILNEDGFVKNSTKPIKQQIFEATEILDSLDGIRKEIRKKFKSITKQEMLVFSTIYLLDEQDPETDYKKIAAKLKLSESSIRDYVQRIVNKGIPIDKEKLNNKKILLHIAPELKKLATLDTIVKLRSL
jgi:hypothetical protein